VSNTDVSRHSTTARVTPQTTPHKVLDHLAGIIDRPGFLEVVAGITQTEAAARGWWHYEESPSPDKIALLRWTRETGDADKRSRKPHTVKWLAVDPQNPATLAKAARTIAALAAQWGNVYTSRVVYSSASRKSPQPSAVLFVEDAPDPATLPLAPTWAIQTSPGSWHAYYRLDRALLPYEVEQLQRRLARAIPDADRGGVDIEQLTRPPATRNTKAKCGDGFDVRLVETGGAVYTVADIEAAYPATASARSGGACDSDSEWAEHLDNLDRAQIEAYLADIGAYLKDGLPRRLGEKARAFWQSVLLWEDTSDARWALTLSALRHGYERELAAAHVYHALYNARKGGGWTLTDAAACVQKQADSLGDAYKPSPERMKGQEGAGAAPAITTPPDSMRRRGRPASSADGILSLARALARRADVEGDRLDYDAQDFADDQEITTRTLRAYLAEMEDARLLDRSKKHGRGARQWVRLLPAFWAWLEKADQKYRRQRRQAADQAPIEATEKADRETDVCREQTRETAVLNTQCIGEEHTAPGAPVPLAPVPADDVPHDARRSTWVDGCSDRRTRLLPRPPSSRRRTPSAKALAATDPASVSRDDPARAAANAELSAAFEPNDPGRAGVFPPTAAASVPAGALIYQRPEVAAALARAMAKSLPPEPNPTPDAAGLIARLWERKTQNAAIVQNG
jgi:hypothetical protein